MTDKQQYLRLGLFVIVSLVLLFCVLFFLGARSLFQPSLTFETYFDGSISGLDVGSPLKYRGVTLGKVSAIYLSPRLYEEHVPVDQRKGYIVVRATVTGPRTSLWKNDLDALIKRGLRVQTQLAGITGQQFLSLDFFDPGTHPTLPFGWEPEYPYIPSVPSIASEIVSNIQRLVSSLDKADVQQIGQNLNALIINANKKLDEVPVAELSAEAMGAIKEARATFDRIDRMLTRAPIDETVRNLTAASRKLDDLLGDPALKRTLTDVSIVTDRLRRIADSGELDRIVRNLDRTIQRADALLADNQYDLRGVVQDLRVTSANLRTLSETAKRYPPGLLIGGPPERVQLPAEPRKQPR
jgi:phospholipid/cholesterol/gamma-HCH transport system substrate-binding protein/paraquat-inducible protein B